MLLRQVHYVSRDVSVVMRFKPLRPDGLLLYTAQYQDGRGDFLSLSLRHGYVEFRYSPILASYLAFFKLIVFFFFI